MRFWLVFFLFITPSVLWSKAQWPKVVSIKKSQVTLTKKVKSRKLGRISDRDLKNLNLARKSFDRRHYKSALAYYGQIDKTSEYWLTSVEERAWAKVHLRKYNEAIADAVTLMSPVFEKMVSPEAYYVSAYVYHRVCDYTRVFEVTDRFKKYNRSRIVHLEKIAQKQWTEVTEKVWGSSLEKGINEESLSLLPLYFYKDKKIISAFGKLNRNQLKNRLAQLALWELKHYQEVIKKLQLIEADAIQRLHLDERMKGQRSWLAKNEKKKDSHWLSFPVDYEDVWLDELDNYDVKAKNCPQLKKASL